MFAIVPMMLAAASTQPTAPVQAVPVYRDSHAPLESRVTDLFGRLTPEEKMDLLTGTDFTTRPIPRLGVQAMAMADAGQGVRGGSRTTEGPATAFPSGVAMASTWDPELISRIGKAIGEEAMNKGTGVQVLLGPAVNIHRSPLGGRNGEYFSEDPFLSARLGVDYIKGMQSTGCAACVKHFAANNEEVDRFTVDVKVGERALREIYLPAFEAAVKEGKVWTLMSSYNLVNGYHSSANHYLLTDVLKKGWGYDGMVMSDWGGVHETRGVINAGNDLEMPGPGYLKLANVQRAFKAGQISQAQIDDNVRRILRTVIRVGLLDTPRVPDHSIVNSTAHQRLTFEAASKGIVLLKNQTSLLPLNAASIKSIAVIGGAADNAQIGAGGSPTVTPFYKIQPLEGIQKRAGKAKVTYTPATSFGQPIPSEFLTTPDGTAKGLQGEYFPNMNLEGKPHLTRVDREIQFSWNGSPAAGIGAENFSARWTGKLVAPKTGRYSISLSADDGCRIAINGKTIVDQWSEGGEAPHSGHFDLVKGQSYDIKIEYFQAGGSAAAKLNWLTPGTKSFEGAVAAAKAAEVAIVCVGTQFQEGEGTDRPSMDLPSSQDELIQAVAKANPRTIVVLNNGTPVTMTEWLNRVPAVVETWLPGQEGGAALAAVLFGDVNPSGKLPDTLAARREDYPDYGNFPGVKDRVDYAEGIYVGYRHFDKKKIAPLFPFGHGLSYTTFKYGPLSVAPVDADGTTSVSFDLTNTGNRTGAEVAQLYVHDEAPKIDKPVRELKGFSKVELKAGETKRITLKLSARDFSYFDVAGKQWKADAGTYDIAVGASSRDLRQHTSLLLPKTITELVPLSAEQVAPIAEVSLTTGHPATASSVQDIAGVQPGNAVDGNANSRWSSTFTVPQWLTVDLEKPTTFDRARLQWEAAYATAYQIQVSDDKQNWSTIYETTAGAGEVEEVSLKPTTARYVRIYMTEKASEFGVSLFEFGLFAPKK